MRNLRNSKGFTLIELMIVVVIIGILAAIAIPKFSQASDRAKEKEADGILKQIYTTQMAYKAQHGTFTTVAADLQQVGYQHPAAAELRHYQVPTLVDLAAGDQCMDPIANSGTHQQRCIDEAGVITGTAPTP